MTSQGWLGVAANHTRALLAVAALTMSACTNPNPVVTFIDDESGLSFNHPPRWNVGFAEQNGMRYRYVTAPSVGLEKEGLSITFIPPSEGASIDTVAQPYLSGASNINKASGPTGSTEWTFNDSSATPSRLRLFPAPTAGRFFGAWARGSEASFKQNGDRAMAVLDSLHAEDPAQWPEEKFAGLSARIPASWTRASRLSNATNASLQFKTTALAVDQGTATIHGFIALSKEPIPAPGDLSAYNKMVKDRASDTVATMEHKPWPAVIGDAVPSGFVDYLRSGNAITATRIRRWITVRNGVGLMLTCEARADAFDRLDPWCRRVAETVRLD